MCDEEVFFELALADLRRAADLFAPAYARSDGVDGWVSLEVSPQLARDTKATIEQAKALHAKAGRPNLFIKIPGTPEGLPAIEECAFSGLPHQRYPAVLGRTVPGRGRRLPAGHRAAGGGWPGPGRGLGCLSLRGPLGHGGGRPGPPASFVTAWAPAAAAGPTRPTGRCSTRLAGDAWRTKVPVPSACCGPAPRPKPGRARRAVRDRTGRPVHHRHHARGDPAGLRRPRAGREPDAGRRRRRRGDAGGLRRGRHRPQGPGRPATAGRSRVLRGKSCWPASPPSTSS